MEFEKISFSVEKKQGTLFASQLAGLPLIILNNFSDDGSAAAELLKQNEVPDCNLLVISGLNWNHDMTPWECPPIFGREPPYTGGADDYLDTLIRKILPQAKSVIKGTPPFIGIAGYSLAGLFALYALSRCDVFSRAASISGSLWYPDFIKFIQEEAPKADRIYLSVGDREAKTRNPILKTVQENTEFAAEHFRSRGTEVIYELNPGNHFQDTDLRTAKGIKALLE